jgi:hypothetical protein
MHSGDTRLLTSPIRMMISDYIRWIVSTPAEASNPDGACLIGSGGFSRTDLQAPAKGSSLGMSIHYLLRVFAALW